MSEECKHEETTMLLMSVGAGLLYFGRCCVQCGAVTEESFANYCKNKQSETTKIEGGER